MEAHGLVDARVEEVDADEGQVGRRVLGLLDQADDLAVGADLGHTEALRVGDAGEQDLGAAGRRGAPSRVGSALRWRSASKVSTNSAMPWRRRLSPRYITKSSSPRKSRAMSTQWASPSGASCGM